MKKIIQPLLFLLIIFLSCNEDQELIDNPNQVSDASQKLVSSVTPNNTLQNAARTSSTDVSKNLLAQSAIKSNVQLYLFSPFTGPFGTKMYPAYQPSKGEKSIIGFGIRFNVTQLNFSPALPAGNLYYEAGALNGQARPIESIQIPYTVTRPITFAFTGNAAKYCKVLPAGQYYDPDWVVISIKEPLAFFGQKCGVQLISSGEILGTVAATVIIDGQPVSSPPLTIYSPYSIKSCLGISNTNPSL